MKLRIEELFLLIVTLGVFSASAQQLRYVQVRTANGILEGVVSPDGKVRTFKGIPYAAPPVGPLRWKAPQTAPSWSGVRKAVDFAPRAMQGRIYDDMVFNDNGPSEDCLYLNLWMPENSGIDKLPVMVWIHGGGFAAGSTSEPRQDAGNLSKKGVMVVSLNYRLGVFGFFAHPELTKESGHNASGNYGLMDQVAALRWIRENIAVFGGDPDNVTIFGESAGSSSVCALMASPLAQGLFRRAIGESSALFRTTSPTLTRAEAEESGAAFAESDLHASSLEALRTMPAAKILEAALRHPHDLFGPIVDGYFLPADCAVIYADGKQSRVPLLAGWNRDESDYKSFLGDDEPTVDNFVSHARTLFGKDADEFLKLYPAATNGEAKLAAHDIAVDKSNAYETWKWMEMHRKSSSCPVYRYEFDRALPLAADAKPGEEPRAPHAGEIEYVFEVLSSKHLPWAPEDFAVSDIVASYWTNFAKTGDPNGPGLPAWPTCSSENGYQVMHLDVNSFAAPDVHRLRYEFLDRHYSSH